MSRIDKEKLIKADIASIENRVRHAFNQGYKLGFKDGKERTKSLKQEQREITLEDVKEYCKPRCLTIISNELLYELTHPKIKASEQEPKTGRMA